jgi:c-di-GMP-binding flagellar brake protein YcgR
MSFIHEGSLVGLRGVATTASEDMTELAFVVSDGVQVEERRVAERVELITRARIAAITDHEAGGESPTDTFTADISLGGVRIQHRPGLGAGPGFRVELFFAGDPTPIACEAQLARRTPTHLGLRFIDLPAAERSRLARILTEYQLRARPTA